MSDKFEDEQVPTVVQQETVRPRKRGFAGHCMRFWWLYLLALIAIVLIVVLVIIFVAVPKIAQDRINSAKLGVQGISATNTETNTLLMGINSTIEADDSIHATIAGFNGSMYLTDKYPHTPFLYVQFPETTSASHSVVNISQQVQVYDMAAFSDFNAYVLANQTFNVTIYGKTTVRVKGIAKNYDVTFNKTVNVPGFNSFSGLEVLSSNVSLTADSQGDNFHGITNIKNPSYFTLEVGNATFGNYLNGSKIGEIYLDNFILRPGDNIVPMRGNVSQLPVLNYLTSEPACQTGIASFGLEGETVLNNGYPLPYFVFGLQAGTPAATFNVSQDLLDIGIKTNCSGFYLNST